VDGGLQQGVVLDVLALRLEMFQRAGEKAAGAAGGVEDFSPICGLTVSTMNCVTARGV